MEEFTHNMQTRGASQVGHRLPTLARLSFRIFDFGGGLATVLSYRIILYLQKLVLRKQSDTYASS